MYNQLIFVFFISYLHTCPALAHLQVLFFATITIFFIQFCLLFPISHP